MHKFLFKFKDTRNFGVIVDHTAIISAENPFQATEIAKEKFQHCGEIWRGFSIEIVIDDFTCEHEWVADGRIHNNEAGHNCKKCGLFRWINPSASNPATRSP